MRNFSFLAPLAMLLLSSCDPAGGTSDAGHKPNDRRGGWVGNIGTGEVSDAQLNARESVGKPQTPQNLVTSIDDTCPVHHEKMRMRELPVVFEDGETVRSQPGKPLASARFPFGSERITSTGNALLPSATQTARAYQCASCVKARRAAEAQPAAPARKPG
jgi:hypothetical protein